MEKCICIDCVYQPDYPTDMCDNCEYQSDDPDPDFIAEMETGLTKRIIS